MQPYFHQWQRSSTLSYKPQQPTIPLFALTRGKRSKRQLSKSFTVVIQHLSTRLIKPNFCLDLVGCAASDRIDEKRIYSQLISFQIWLSGMTKFAGIHVKSCKRSFRKAWEPPPFYLLMTELASSKRHDFECHSFHALM